MKELFSSAKRTRGWTPIRSYILIVEKLSVRFRVWNSGITSFKETPQQPFDPVNACPHHSSYRINQLLGLKPCLLSEPALCPRPQAGLAGAFRWFSELGHGLRLLATADAGSLAGLVARALSVGPAGGCQGEPPAWPPNKLKEKKCIGSILRTDLTNLKSKGLLPPGRCLPYPWTTPTQGWDWLQSKLPHKELICLPRVCLPRDQSRRSLFPLPPYSRAISFPERLLSRGKCFRLWLSQRRPLSWVSQASQKLWKRKVYLERLQLKTRPLSPVHLRRGLGSGEWGGGGRGREERKGREGGGEEVRVLFLQ